MNRVRAVVAMNHGFPREAKNGTLRRRKRDMRKILELKEKWENWNYQDLTWIVSHTMEELGEDTPLEAVGELILRIQELDEVREARDEWKPDPQKVAWAPLTDEDENGVRYFNYSSDEMKTRLEVLRAMRSNRSLAHLPNGVTGYLRRQENFHLISKTGLFRLQ